MEVRVVEISFHSPHPRLLPKGARGLLFPRRCLEAALDPCLFMYRYMSKGRLLASLVTENLLKTRRHALICPYLRRLGGPVVHFY